MKPAACRTWAAGVQRRQRLRPFANSQRALCGLALAATLAAQGAAAEVIHRERSLYQTILVTKRASTLCLQFSQRRMQRKQSCLDQRRPKEMALTYTKMMMAALLLNPSPSRALIIGLGGGTLPMALAALHPEADIDVVEIDPAVVKVAQRYFGFTEGDNLRVHVQDARVFTRRASQAGPAYDLIMLDAFGADYIPEHLMTREFLREVLALLQENGALAANTFATSKLYDHESVTYRDVFGSFFNLRLRPKRQPHHSRRPSCIAQPDDAHRSRQGACGASRSLRRPHSGLPSAVFHQDRLGCRRPPAHRPVRSGQFAARRVVRH